MAEVEHDPASFEFVTDGPIWKGIPVVNGHKLMSVMSADVHLDGESLPEVTLRLFAGDLLKLGLGAAEVRMDEGTREALVSLGWTPPGEPALVASYPEDWTPEQIAEFREAWDDFETRYQVRRPPPGPGSSVHPCEITPLEPCACGSTHPEGYVCTQQAPEATLPPGSECAP